MLECLDQTDPKRYVLGDDLKVLLEAAFLVLVVEESPVYHHDAVAQDSDLGDDYHENFCREVLRVSPVVAALDSSVQSWDLAVVLDLRSTARDLGP